MRLGRVLAGLMPEEPEVHGLVALMEPLVERHLAWIEQIVVDAGPDVADDWIAERAGPGDIVITADIPLADRCLKAGAQALKSNGQSFTPDMIGSALAGRMVGEHLRSMGVATSGPPPFGPKDRSAFLQALDTAVVRAKRVST